MKTVEARSRRHCNVPRIMSRENRKGVLDLLKVETKLLYGCPLFGVLVPADSHRLLPTLWGYSAFDEKGAVGLEKRDVMKNKFKQEFRRRPEWSMVKDVPVELPFEASDTETDGADEKYFD